jgi:hypothetical protein
MEVCTSMPGLLTRLLRWLVRRRKMEILDPDGVTSWIINKALEETGQWGMPLPLLIKPDPDLPVVHLIFEDVVLWVSRYYNSATVRVASRCPVCGRRATSVECMSLADVEEMMEDFLPNPGHTH